MLCSPLSRRVFGSLRLSYSIYRRNTEKFAMERTPQPFASPQRADESIRVIAIDESYSGCSWHFHPELQLCHVGSGCGQRMIGDRVCDIEPGEVILLVRTYRMSGDTIRRLMGRSRQPSSISMFPRWDAIYLIVPNCATFGCF